uniref:HECT domain-containing protein n=1 Tax=Strongyloides venezuelensis TaxID=75913 RepID=A0A0K0FPM8_STRVS
MGAQPVTTYEGIMPYFQYMKREFYVNADPRISLTQFFLRSQSAELRTTFYSMFEGNLKDITEEEIESSRGISELPIGYLARLNLMVLRIGNFHNMLPEGVFILTKLLNEIPKPVCADLADKYEMNPTNVC